MIMSKASEKREAQSEAIERLRALFPVGSTVSTVLRYVARSGMSRSISVLAIEYDVPVDVSYLVARALDMRMDNTRGGIRSGGCGMDMGFALVYSLGRVLYREGFPCTGEQRGRDRCPSNDHSNEREPNYTAGRLHSDPGYALNHRWI